MSLILCLIFLGSPTPVDSPTFVYLVRHAEKVDDSKDPLLNQRGKERAQELVSFFSKNPIDAFFSSQYKRTVHTLRPIVTAQDGELVQIAAQEPQHLVNRVKAMKGKRILIAGHSNTIPDLIKRFGGPDVQIDDSDYRNLFLLVLVEDKATLQVFQLQP